MKFYLIFSVSYFIIAQIIAYLGMGASSAALETIVSGVIEKLPVAGVIGVALFCGWRLSPGQQSQQPSRLHWTVFKISQIVVVAYATFLFHSAFSTIKAALPNFVPFYADPFWMRVDAVLHGGQQPWIWLHNWAIQPDRWMINLFYFHLWMPLAILFPTILLLADRDKGRQRRFIVLYLAAWIVIGNVLALAGMSAGPVFYDRLFGMGEFVALIPALDASGVTSSLAGQAQDFLWSAYATDQQHLGSGISAFPSVHIAVATVWALYLRERFPRLWPLGALYTLIILHLSVYTGFHYAVDGYASILLITALWACYKRWDTARSAAPHPQAHQVSA